MRILNNFEQNSPEWLEERRGKITGSKLYDVLTFKGTNKKIGFFQLIADKLSITDESEDGNERGHALEQEALEKVARLLDVKIDVVGFCVREDYPDIGLSPDGLISNDGKYTEAVEVKCLSGARHIEAWYNQKLPTDFQLQAIQYFIVNDDLETLYFAFYDPRIAVISLHYLTIEREELKDDIGKYLQEQINTLNEVNEIVNKLSF